MRRCLLFRVAILVCIQFILGIVLTHQSLAQEWEIRKPKGILRIVDLGISSLSAMFNYSESLVARDKDDNWVPCLAEDWRWLSDRTIEFKLREGIRFQNGEKFNADAVEINWEAYRKLENPFNVQFVIIPDETKLEKIGEYTVRFSFPEPEGLAFVKLQ